MKKSSAWEFETPGGLYDKPETDLEVISPVARRVLAAARKALPLNTHRGPAFDDLDGCPLEIHQYQIWLHARLRSSGLAKGLAGGPAFLHDVAGELSWPWNVLARLFAPRTYEQLTRRVAQNLEWYVDQSKPVSDPWKSASELFAPCLFCTALTMVVLYFATGLRELNWVLLTGSGMLLFAFIFTSLIVFSRNTHKHATNTAELYSYLAESYGEAAESDHGKNAERWHKLISGLKQFTNVAD